LPLVTGGSLTLVGAQDTGRGLQGDTAFAEIVRAIGGSVSANARGLDVSFPARNLHEEARARWRRPV
jgi:hypothetical protein